MEFCGETSLPFLVEATKKVMCIELPLYDFKNILLNDNTFLRFLLRSVGHKMALFTESEASFSNLEEKLLHFLKYDCPDHQFQGVEATVIQLRCSRRQLQRLLKSLTERQIIEKKGKGIYRLKWKAILLSNDGFFKQHRNSNKISCYKKTRSICSWLSSHIPSKPHTEIHFFHPIFFYPDCLVEVLLASLTEQPQLWLSLRPISISQLHALLHFHLWPIYLVVFKGSYRFRMGYLILRGASRLDAFSVYPFPTWLPGYAPGGTTGAPEVSPSRSSRTKDSSSQISCAHAG